MASAVARAYNGGLRADPPAGSRGRGAKFLAFGRSMKTANLPIFRNFGNTKTSDIYVVFAKNHEWPRNWGGAEQNWRVCAGSKLY